MYGKPALTLPVTGAAALPMIGSGNTLISVAATMLVLGAVVYVISLIVSRKLRSNIEEA